MFTKKQLTSAACAIFGGLGMTGCESLKDAVQITVINGAPAGNYGYAYNNHYAEQQAMMRQIAMMDMQRRMMYQNCLRANGISGWGNPNTLNIFFQVGQRNGWNCAPHGGGAIFFRDFQRSYIQRNGSNSGPRYHW